MTAASALERGRAAFGRQAWGNAYAQLLAADREGLLDPENLERLATAAYLIGRDHESVDAWARAHHEWVRLREMARAARCAFWLAFGLLNKGELALGGGWYERARRLLDVNEVDCVERGHVRYLMGLRSVFEGDVPAGHAAFSDAAECGERFRELELTALARIGQGRCLIYLGKISEGVALLDEAMVAVMAHEVSPIAVGDSYCTVIEGCEEVFDLRRTREWTAALGRWLESQPELVLYRGHCLVHRAEIMQPRGEWSDAMDEVESVLGRLARQAGPRAEAAACYLRGEIHRLRGEFAEAVDAFRRANRLGREPQPGLAQLRFAQGHVEAATAAVRRVLDEAQDPTSRARVLAPYVEILLAAGDLGAARMAADELSQLAALFDAPLLHARAASSTGAVLLAEGDARAAVGGLRRAWTVWQELEAPYEAARVRVLIALACRELGDQDAAEMELDAARQVFQQLGAVPDLGRVEQLSLPTTPKAAGGLTAREVQVLRLIAAGKSNRAIAAELVLSVHTVHRHVQNIFAKLGVGSRTAAAAFAFENNLA